MIERSGRTVIQQLELQAKARVKVLGVLEENDSSMKPQTLVRKVAHSSSSRVFPDYIVKRAVWSVLADDKAHFDDENKVILGKMPIAGRP